MLKVLKSGTKKETTWKLIRDSPHLAPNLDVSQFDLAFTGLAAVPNREAPHADKNLEDDWQWADCMMRYG